MDNKIFHFRTEHEAHLALHRIQALGFDGQIVGDCGSSYPPIVTGGIQLIVVECNSDEVEEEPEIGTPGALENTRVLVFLMLCGVGLAIFVATLLPVLLVAVCMGVVLGPYLDKLVRTYRRNQARFGLATQLTCVIAAACLLILWRPYLEAINPWASLDYILQRGHVEEPSIIAL